MKINFGDSVEKKEPIVADDKNSSEGFNHGEHMQKMQAGISEAIGILQGLLAEEGKEQEVEGEPAQGQSQFRQDIGKLLSK